MNKFSLVSYRTTTLRMIHLKILLFTFLFFFSRFVYAQESEAKRRFDSLSRTGSVKDDRVKPTSYLFDSVFVVSGKYLQKNIQLTKTISYTKLIYDSKDSTVFYVMTGKAVILNEALLKPQGHYILIDHCARSNVKLLSSRSLKDKYGIQNINGGYVIKCD